MIAIDLILPDLSVDDFASNLMAALRMITYDDGHWLPTSWRFCSANGHRAALAAYQYIAKLQCCSLRFRILLDPIYGDSPVWTAAVIAQCEMRNLVQLGIYDVFEIARFITRLDERMTWPLAVGDREVWLGCARAFYDGYIGV